MACKIQVSCADDELKIFESAHFCPIWGIVGYGAGVLWGWRIWSIDDTSSPIWR